MATVLAIGQWLIENYQAVIASIIALLMGVIGVALLIPGPEPERTLQKIVDFLRGISRKSDPPSAGS